MECNCKKCTHQFVCDIRDCDFKNNCPHYQDISKVVALLCNVGDKVYFIKTMFSFMQKPMAEVIRKIEITKYDIVFRTENKTFTDKNINNTVFLTKTEAENALKEVLKNE